MEYYAFPTAQALAKATEEQLQECNLGYRAKYVLDTARRVVFGDFDPDKLYDMKYQRARKELLQLYGGYRPVCVPDQWQKRQHYGNSQLSGL